MMARVTPFVLGIVALLALVFGCLWCGSTLADRHQRLKAEKAQARRALAERACAPRGGWLYVFEQDCGYSCLRGVAVCTDGHEVTVP
jgi:hypothetical protein